MLCGTEAHRSALLQVRQERNFDARDHFKSLERFILAPLFMVMVWSIIYGTVFYFQPQYPNKIFLVSHQSCKCCHDFIGKFKSIRVKKLLGKTISRGLYVLYIPYLVQLFQEIFPCYQVVIPMLGIIFYLTILNVSILNLNKFYFCYLYIYTQKGLF